MFNYGISLFGNYSIDSCFNIGVVDEADWLLSYWKSGIVSLECSKAYLKRFGMLIYIFLSFSKPCAAG